METGLFWGWATTISYEYGTDVRSKNTSMIQNNSWKCNEFGDAASFCSWKKKQPIVKGFNPSQGKFSRIPNTPLSNLFERLIRTEGDETMNMIGCAINGIEVDVFLGWVFLVCENTFSRRASPSIGILFFCRPSEMHAYSHV